MNTASNLSKLKMYILLLIVFSIGTIGSLSHITNVNAIAKGSPTTSSNDLTNVFNCITQKVNKSGKVTLSDAFVCYDTNLKGASKFANQPFQNPDLSNLNNIQTVSDTTLTTTSTDKIAGTSGSDNSSSNSPSKTANSNTGFQDVGTKLNWNPFDEIGKKKSSLKPKIDKVADSGIKVKQDVSGTPTDKNSASKPTDPFSAVDAAAATSKNKPVDTGSTSDKNSASKPTDPFNGGPLLKSPSKLKTTPSSLFTSALGSFDLPFSSILPQ
jgi:hypothetical protein